jgi:hypothetical protein
MGPRPEAFVPFTRNSDYDYETAELYGLRPGADGHWQSRIPKGPEEGLLLKSEKHPTFYKTLEGEMQAGYNIFRAPSGRLYSLPVDRNVPEEYIPYQVRGRQEGGSVQAGMPYLVGEGGKGGYVPFANYVRDPYQSELGYFKSNPSISGMMTEDSKIIVNPYSKLSNSEKQAVIANEGYRLLMKQGNITPDFQLTPAQIDRFKDTPYGKNPTALKQSIVARILSGDPSAAATPEQKEAAKNILNRIHPLVEKRSN